MKQRRNKMFEDLNTKAVTGGGCQPPKNTKKFYVDIGFIQKFYQNIGKINDLKLEIKLLKNTNWYLMKNKEIKKNEYRITTS